MFRLDEHHQSFLESLNLSAKAIPICKIEYYFFHVASYCCFKNMWLTESLSPYWRKCCVPFPSHWHHAPVILKQCQRWESHLPHFSICVWVSHHCLWHRPKIIHKWSMIQNVWHHLLGVRTQAPMIWFSGVKGDKKWKANEKIVRWVTPARLKTWIKEDYPGPLQSRRALGCSP